MSSELYPLRTLHLFAGAGGGILGDILLGHRCVCAVEIEPYCQQVLSARQEDGILPWFPIFDDVRSFDGTPWRGLVDVVSGGFPCQDISSAGKGAGIEGERSGMWKEMARIIGEVRPRFALVENSPVLTSRGLGVVLGDLAALGYDAEWGVLGASDAGAPHQRERIWIVAYPNRFDAECGSREGSGVWGEETFSGSDDHTGGPSAQPGTVQHPIGQLANANMLGCLHGQAEEQPTEGRQYAQREPEPSGEDVSHPNGNGLQGGIHKGEHGEQWGHRPSWTAEERGPHGRPGLQGGSWWSTEPGLGGMVDGVADILDSLRKNAYLRLSTMAR